MKEKIINLSKIYNSLEIARQLDYSLNKVEEILINNYYRDTWKIKKDDLLEAATRVYNESPVIISKDYGVSEPTLKKCLNECHLYNDKRGQISNVISITDDLKKQIIQDYQSQLSIIQICAKHRITKKYVNDILKNANVSTSKITFNENIFDTIDSEEKAYWLGFLYADGAVGSTDNSVEISLKLLDAEHLYKFKSFLNAKRDIRLDFKIKRCRFTAISKHFKERLIELGCTPQKSLTLKFPTEEQVPKEYIISFIRGYFDGDGVLSHDGGEKRLIPNTGMLGTEDFLLGAFKYLPEGINHHMFQANKDGAKECKQVSWGKNDSGLILELFYNNAHIYLNRKYFRYQKFKENNLAVLRSDFENNDRAISEKAKQWINKTFNIDVDKELQVNSEINIETKKAISS